ncbi:hypothetical protein [Demequina sp. NBRC 110056]|uniref:hypothetical protein n=1 Tax=Demequina sp. NBRC 110056 TaxID=1570345 RepID=UPI0009FFD209|nr:hypothetical protein [Demequina sp. NBRC 110056]
MSDTTDEYARGQREERERFAEYLAHFEKGSRERADAATTDESRVYQTTIANAMKAMREAIRGGFHWQDGWRQES